MNPLDLLCIQDSVSSVDVAGARAFVQEPDPGLLFLPGDRSRPEVTDVAVVANTLHRRYPELRVAVAKNEAEDTLRGAFGIALFPSLLFVKGGEVKISLARMQTWSIYDGAARSIVGES